MLSYLILIYYGNVIFVNVCCQLTDRKSHPMQNELCFKLNCVKQLWETKCHPMYWSVLATKRAMYKFCDVCLL